MKSEVVYISGKEIKDTVKQLGFIYFNGYKFFLTEKELERLVDGKTYEMSTKYALLFIKPIYSERAVIVKRGQKVQKKST